MSTEKSSKKLDLGQWSRWASPQLKNIAERFQVYALLPEPPKGFRQTPASTTPEALSSGAPRAPSGW